MEPAEAMAVLSMLVFEENNSEPSDLNATLSSAKKTVENIVRPSSPPLPPPTTTTSHLLVDRLQISQL
jgi:hypothetical protein